MILDPKTKQVWWIAGASHSKISLSRRGLSLTLTAFLTTEPHYRYIKYKYNTSERYDMNFGAWGAMVCVSMIITAAILTSHTILSNGLIMGF